ncbi:MAG: hypothetical protein ACI9MC_004254 [Kiritimatiellia bacterium]|jgi:hypothetical protein
MHTSTPPRHRSTFVNGRLSLTSLAFLLTAACAPPEPLIAIGSGELDWLQMTDGDEIEVVYGPQGGYHFYGSVRLANIEAGDASNVESSLNPTTRFEAWVDDTPLVMIEPFTQGYDLAAEDAEPFTHELTGRLVIIDIDDDDEINGKDVRFEVTVTDHLGQVHRDVRNLLVVPNQYND